MKKIISLLMCFLVFTVASQAQTAFSHTASNPTGAILNTSSDTMTYSMQKGYASVGIFSEDLTAKSETVTTETTVIKTKKVKKNEKDN